MISNFLFDNWQLQLQVEIEGLRQPPPIAPRLPESEECLRARALARLEVKRTMWHAMEISLPKLLVASYPTTARALVVSYPTTARAADATE